MKSMFPLQNAAPITITCEFYWAMIEH